MAEPKFEPHAVEWTPDQVDRFWNFYSRHQSVEFFSAVYASSLVALVASRRPRRYLDIGCGTGELVIRAARRGIAASGIDGSRDLIDKAITSASGINPPVEFRQAQVTAVPWEDDTFDAATLIEVVEHLDDDALSAAMAEVRRVLRPGGSLILTTPYREDLTAETVQCPDCGAEFHRIQHVRSWTPRTLATMLEANGFDPHVRAVRLTEEGPTLERVARAAFYRLSRAKRHVVATATVLP